jgi:hypothetical protein
MSFEGNCSPLSTRPLLIYRHSIQEILQPESESECCGLSYWAISIPTCTAHTPVRLAKLLTLVRYWRPLLCPNLFVEHSGSQGRHFHDRISHSAFSNQYRGVSVAHSHVICRERVIICYRYWKQRRPGLGVNHQALQASDSTSSSGTSAPFTGSTICQGMLETRRVNITIGRHCRALHDKQSVLYNANYVADFERIYIYSLQTYCCVVWLKLHLSWPGLAPTQP